LPSGRKSRADYPSVWQMLKAGFRLQSISFRLLAAGSFSKVEQQVAARAEPSSVQEGEYLISW
jgi:hypothetical protein